MLVWIARVPATGETVAGAHGYLGCTIKERGDKKLNASHFNPYSAVCICIVHKIARRADYQGRAFVNISTIKWLPASVREKTAGCGLSRPHGMRIRHVQRR